MQCSDFEKYAQAYVDGEFDPLDEAEIHSHLASCEGCRRQVVQLESFKRFMGSQPSEVAVPAEVRKIIMHTVAESSARGSIKPQWIAFAVAAMLSLAILTFSVLRPPGDQATTDADLFGSPIIDTSIDLHQRNLPVEVTGPDTHVVSEWVSNHVDFPVRLPTFQNPRIRANVLGARLNRIDNQEAAQVVYEVDGNKLSLVMFRTRTERFSVVEREDEGQRVMILNRHGYNVAVFNNDGITYSFTSSLSQRHMRELVQSAAFRTY